MDNQDWLIGLVAALLIFVVGCSVLFSITKSERFSIAGGGILFVLTCIFLRMHGWL